MSGQASWHDHAAHRHETLFGVVQVKTYRDVLEDYRTHPKSRSLGPDGSPCTRQTTGLVRRRSVTALYLTHVGKESNRLEEVEAGLVTDPEAVYTTYEDPAHGFRRTIIVPVLNEMPRSQIQQRTRLSRTQITATWNCRAAPHSTTRETLIEVAVAFASTRLGSSRRLSPHERLATCDAFLRCGRKEAS